MKKEIVRERYTGERPLFFYLTYLVSLCIISIDYQGIGEGGPA